MISIYIQKTFKPQYFYKKNPANSRIPIFYLKLYLKQFLSDDILTPFRAYGNQININS